MKAYKFLSILVLLSMILAACGTPTAVVTVPTQPSAPNNTAAAPAVPTATQAAAQPTAVTTTLPVATAATAATATLASLKYSEAPMLADQVKAGKLPPLEQRLPKDVAVAETVDGTAAKYGGQMNLVGTSGTGGVDAQMLEDVMMGLSMPDPTYQNYYPNIAKGWKLSDDGKTSHSIFAPGDEVVGWG